MEIEHRIRIHQLIEFIKQDSEFPFDTHDELEDVLLYYDTRYEFDREAQGIIRQEVTKIAENRQTAEISRIVEEDPDAEPFQK